MPRPRFQKLKEEKQERILMAAAAEFGRKGFEAASFNQIIEDADISKGAAYYYFDDKDDLYATVIEFAWKRLTDFFGDFVFDASTPENFWDTLEEYSGRSMHRAQEHPKLTQLIRTVLSYARLHPHAAGGALVANATRAMTLEFLVRGQALGVIRTDLPQELLLEIVLGVGYATDTWVLDHLNEMPTDDIDNYAHLLTNIYRQICEPPRA